jgi:hypothetical protein
LRVPNAVLHGRLWAEEGKVFFARAYDHAWYEALTMPLAGYLNLVATATATVVRHLVPLEAAPWFFTGLALIFQCCPAILLMCSGDAWLRAWPVKASALLLLATPPMVDEVWLQTLHSQFHLALCCALILCLDVPGRRLRWFGLVLLFLTPLCGPLVGTLLPLFLLRAARDRSRVRVFQAAALAAGLAVQLAFFFSVIPGRNYGMGPIYLLCVIYLRQIVEPLFGMHAAAAAFQTVKAGIDARLFPWWPVIVSITCIIAMAVAVLRRRAAAFIWLFAAASVLGSAAYLGAISNDHQLLAYNFGERYVFLPEVLGALLVLGLATGERRPDSRAAGALVVWLILVGLHDFRDRSWTQSGPSWLSEVAAWRRDHTHPIAIWPNGWTMRLERD